jgi:hypothetical protein
MSANSPASTEVMLGDVTGNDDATTKVLKATDVKVTKIEGKRSTEGFGCVEMRFSRDTSR